MTGVAVIAKARRAALERTARRGWAFDEEASDLGIRIGEVDTAGLVAAA